MFNKINFVLTTLQNHLIDTRYFYRSTLALPCLTIIVSLLRASLQKMVRYRAYVEQHRTPFLHHTKN